MFQLNSYAPSTHIKWIKINLKKYLSQILILLIIVIAFFAEKVAGIILLLLFIIMLVPRHTIKAKKPLVYTSRVKRLLVTECILLVLVIFLLINATYSIGYMLICLLYFISPVFVLLMNYINWPIEGGIRRYYINDAKKILRACPNLIVIGVTGSYGKTSVKHYLATVMKAKYNVLMTPESYNTTMGVVRTIRENLRSTHQVFICEMGARRVSDIKKICDIVSPQYGILTSIGPQHLETFRTIENVINTKFELADAVGKNGMMFLNGDNEWIKENLNKATRYTTYGLTMDNEFKAHDINYSKLGATFDVSGPDVQISGISTSLIGRHNIQNIMGAISVGSYFGISGDELRTQVKKIGAVPHRLQVIERNGFIIIDDAYNSNPNGCKMALETMSLFDGFKILITPGMVELGSKQYELNNQFGVEASKYCDYIILVGKKQTQPIYEGIMSAGYSDDNVFVAKDIGEAFQQAEKTKTEKQKIILIENDLPDNF